MGKAKKLHRKKVAKRNEKLKQQANIFNKWKEGMVRQILEEKREGKFNDENLLQLPSDNDGQENK